MPVYLVYQFLYVLLFNNLEIEGHPVQKYVLFQSQIRQSKQFHLF